MSPAFLHQMCEVTPAGAWCPGTGDGPLSVYSTGALVNMRSGSSLLCCFSIPFHCSTDYYYASFLLFYWFTDFSLQALLSSFSGLQTSHCNPCSEALLFGSLSPISRQFVGAPVTNIALGLVVTNLQNTDRFSSTGFPLLPLSSAVFQSTSTVFESCVMSCVKCVWCSLPQKPFSLTHNRWFSIQFPQWLSRIFIDASVLQSLNHGSLVLCG